MPATGYELPTFLVLGRALSLAAPGWYVDEELVEPDADDSSFSLRDPDGRLFVTDRVVTVSNGIAVVALEDDDLDGTTLPQERAWREVWTLNVGGVDQVVERELYVCRAAPRPLVTEGALFPRHPSWRDLKPPGVPTLGEQISAAWGEVVRQLIGKKILPSKILDSTALFDLHLQRTIEMYAHALAETGLKQWDVIGDRADKKYTDLLKDLVLNLDNNDDGIEDSNARQAAEPELFATYVPRCFGWQT